MTNQQKGKRQRKTIEEKLQEIEDKEKKLNLEKSKLLEKKKEEIEKINTKKKNTLFNAFKKNIENWENLSNDELVLLCDELFSKYGTEINNIL